MDIDEDTVDNNNIYVLNNKTKHISPLMLLLTDIIPRNFMRMGCSGDEYLVITDTGIQSITEKKLDLAMMRRITLKVMLYQK